MVYAIGIDDPTANLFSPTAISKSAELSQVVADGVTDIITGRKDMGSFDDIVSGRKSRGGDTVRKEYEDANAKNKGEEDAAGLAARDAGARRHSSCAMLPGAMR